LFNRFEKSDKSSKSLGLGLAIVKKICDVYEFTVLYLFEKGNHNITIKF
jgi:K+-sensing histidine kinase KdpD